jgi:heat shock protein HslJ
MKVNKLVLMIGVLMVMVLASACVPISAPAGDGEAVESGAESVVVDGVNTVLEGTSWQLTEIVGADGALAPVAEGVEATITFEGGTASGTGGCNRFNAGYTLVGQSDITFGPAASTMMACMGPGAEVEPLFFAMLENAASYEAAMGALTIADADGNILAMFSEVVPVELVGTNWSATMVNNGREAVTGLVEGTTITAVFNEDGTLTGQACNNYSFGYTLDGDNIAIEPGLSTMMACENPDEMAQETAYLQMLPEASTWSIIGDTLELRTADGALIASYAAE